MASMSLQLRIGLVTIGFVVICFANVSAARGQQKLLTPEQRHIVDTVSSMFTALRTDDIPKFDSVIAPDFYIFDEGTRFNGETIMGLIKAQHAAGKRMSRT
jgi:hypothetical protein